MSAFDKMVKVILDSKYCIVRKGKVLTNQDGEKYQHNHYSTRSNRPVKFPRFLRAMWKAAKNEVGTSEDNHKQIKLNRGEGHIVIDIVMDKYDYYGFVISELIVF